MTELGRQREGETEEPGGDLGGLRGLPARLQALAASGRPPLRPRSHCHGTCASRFYGSQCFRSVLGAKINACTRFDEVCSCCCSLLLPQLVCNILTTTYKLLVPGSAVKCTGSLSHLRTMLPESISRPLPAQRPNHAI